MTRDTHRSLRHDEQRPARRARAWRRPVDERVDGVVLSGAGRAEAEQRRDEGRAVRQARAGLVHLLNLVALEHHDVDELARLLPAPVLDDEQPRLDDFQHEAETRDGARRAPHVQPFAVAPDAEVYAGALHRRRQPRQGRGREGEGLLEGERLPGAAGRQEGERNLRRVAFLAPEARPEGGVDDRSMTCVGPLRRSSCRTAAGRSWRASAPAPLGGCPRGAGYELPSSLLTSVRSCELRTRPPWPEYNPDPRARLRRVPLFPIVLPYECGTLLCATIGGPAVMTGRRSAGHARPDGVEDPRIVGRCRYCTPPHEHSGDLSPSTTARYPSLPAGEKATFLRVCVSITTARQY